MTVSPSRLRLVRRVLELAAAPLAVLTVALPACFDESNYQGGGRRDIGGQLVPVDGGGEDLDAGLDEDVVVVAPDASADAGPIVDVGDAG